MPTSLTTLSASLEQRRKAMGLSFIDLTLKTGLSRQAIYRLFHGQDVQLTTLMAVCKVLKLEVMALPLGLGSLVAGASPTSSKAAFSSTSPVVSPGRSMAPHLGFVVTQNSVPSALEERMRRLRAAAEPDKAGKRS